MKILLIALVAFLIPSVAQSQGAYWCLNEDEIWTEVQGTSVIFHHDAALYNCCLNPFEYLITWEDGHLVVVEDEILINGCWCQCCYDLEVRVDDMPPGESTVIFRWYDEEANEWLEVELEINIPNSDDPESPPGEKVQVGNYWQSECLAAMTPVPEEPEPPRPSWGGLKSWYR